MRLLSLVLSWLWLCSVAWADSVLVQYGFDSTLPSAEDGFYIFENSRGFVEPTNTVHFSGYRSLELQEAAVDGTFVELQDVVPPITEGDVLFHFAFLVRNPEEELSIAVAGPQHFFMRRDGIAFWLKTIDGVLFHHTDSLPRRLFKLQANTWYVVVDEAYQAIPHRRTPYDAQRSTLGATEREFLAELFALSDEALVERVTTLAAFREGNRAQLERYEEHITRILTALRAMPEPASAHGLAATLGQAIELQRTFFRSAFAAATKDVQLASDLHVHTTSNELRRLYTDLKTRYSGEHPHNRDAFYQHLCTLDFL